MAEPAYYVREPICPVCLQRFGYVIVSAGPIQVHKNVVAGTLVDLAQDQTIRCVCGTEVVVKFLVQDVS